MNGMLYAMSRYNRIEANAYFILLRRLIRLGKDLTKKREKKKNVLPVFEQTTAEDLELNEHTGTAVMVLFSHRRNTPPFIDARVPYYIVWESGERRTFFVK